MLSKEKGWQCAQIRPSQALFGSNVGQAHMKSSPKFGEDGALVKETAAVLPPAHFSYQAFT